MDCADGAGADGGEDRSKVSDLKEQTLQLARIACHGDEEKSQTELLEKLRTCSKHTLVEFCRSFDIIGSTANKKHELVAIVMEFLMEYCSVTDGSNPTKTFKKRRRKRDGANLSSGKHLKKKKPELPDQTALERLGEEEADRRKGEEDITNYSALDTKNDIYECADDKKGQFPKEEANTEPSERANGFMPENLDGVTLTDVPIPTNEETVAITPSAKLVSDVEGDKTNAKAPRKKNTANTKEKTTTKTGLKDKPRGKLVSRGDVKPQKHAVKPSKDELRQAVFIILDTADFATMTFGDIVKQVDKYFGKDLFERKPLIRSLIEEELFRLAEEAEKKELEEEEAAKAKARAEAAKKRAKDGRVESDINKTNELEAGQDQKSIHAARKENGNSFEKGVKGGISLKAAQNRNRDAAVGSSQNSRGEDDVNKKNSITELTNNGNSEKVMQDANGHANIEASGDGKAETEKENSNSDTVEGSEYGKTDEINDTKIEDTEDGRTEECRSGNGGDNAEDVNNPEAEEPNTNENGEHVERVENGKTQEIGNTVNSENTVSPGTKCGKPKEAMENVNTEKTCVTDAAGDGTAEDDELQCKHEN